MKNHRFSIRSFALMCWIGAAGCNLLPTSPTQPAAKVEPAQKPMPMRVSQFVFNSDIEMSKDQPIFKELSEMREKIFTDLRLPPSTTLVQVQLFADRDKYKRFMQSQYPELPERRAFFAAKPKQPRSLGGDDLLVYTYWSDKIDQDLRHEITHALLHSVLKGVPIWLDEGLAEYYEMRPGWNGVNYQHLNQLRQTLANGQKPDLARLEHLEKVSEVNHGEYREAWAWVHFMMNSSPQTRQVLIYYLKDLRSNPNPGPLRPRLAAVVPDLDSALERHLANLEQNRGVLATSR